MPNNPVSLRKTRTVVRQSAEALDAQGRAINAQAAALKAIVEIIMGRGFFGRLRWLVTGK